MVLLVFESICVVGERGQITLPKVIRQINGIKSKDKLIVKMENEKMVVEKFLDKKAKVNLMIEGYKKLAKDDLKTAEEMKYVSVEADAMLDDY